MKKSRMMIKRKKRQGNIILITSFCIILPIFAIYIGLRITELWVSPALHSDYDYLLDKEIGSNVDSSEEIEEEKDPVNQEGKNKKSSEKVEENTNLIPRKINQLIVYTIQIASISHNNGVNGLVEELNERQFSNLIYKIDNNYKVYVVGGTKRSPVEGKLEEVRSYYPDAYISELIIPSKIIEYPQSPNTVIYGEIVDDINKIAELLDQQGEEWYKFLEKEGELDTYIELLKKQQIILSQIEENLQNIELPKTLLDKTLIEKMVLYQNRNIKQSLEFAHGGNEDNLYRIHSLYLDSLFRVVELIK